MSGPQYALASFFSGIGGIDLGFERTGAYQIVFQCEIDTFCRTLLQERWPTVSRANDIRRTGDEDVSPADVWVGGFPCQDVSVASMGPRVGLRGKQSSLFFEFARLLEGARPRVFLIENVPGLLSSHGGRDFGIVIQTLAQLGYGVGWRVLNSKNFGVPQSRQRVYIVGCLGDWTGPGQILFEPECGEGHAPEGQSNGKKPLSPFKEVFGDPIEGPIVQGIAYCLYACSSRHTGTDWSRTYVSYPDGRVRRLTPLETERVQGFPDGWTIPVEEYGDLDKLDSLRYRALGNAVTVPVAEWIGGRIARYLDRTRVNALIPEEANAIVDTLH
ncbi:MAG: DNA (cytosine-5-)-methyltransferase [Dehalococcoidia bacterium]|nr:DNA (cytosine-5-)-methyltransferase [Dehalococcoidia bacterium]